MKIYAFAFTIFILLFLNLAHASNQQASTTGPFCGNNIKETGESCDGSDLNSATCVSRGFASGSLSCNASCNFNTSACNNPAAPAAGGGGGGFSPPSFTPKESEKSEKKADVLFSGRAHPKSTVTLLKDAQVVSTSVAGPDANFTMSVSDLPPGNYIFSTYGEDSKGVRSSLQTFPVSVTPGVTTKIGGIFIAPTIAVDKSEVKKGDNITIFGQSTPLSEITISVSSDEEFFEKKMSDADGVYLLNFDTSVLDIGQHHTRSKVAINGEISSFSKVVSFIVGKQNVSAKLPKKIDTKSDLNSDNRVNLVDFSITAYWYKRPSPPPSVDFNGDKKVDLIDFSIMAFYWTG